MIVVAPATLYKPRAVAFRSVIGLEILNGIVVVPADYCDVVVRSFVFGVGIVVSRAVFRDIIIPVVIVIARFYTAEFHYCALDFCHVFGCVINCGAVGDAKLGVVSVAFVPAARGVGIVGVINGAAASRVCADGIHPRAACLKSGIGVGICFTVTDRSVRSVGNKAVFPEPHEMILRKVYRVIGKTLFYKGCFNAGGCCKCPAGAVVALILDGGDKLKFS